MDKLLVSLVIAVLLCGCHLVLPLTEKELAENEPRNSNAILIAGQCHYDNGKITGLPEDSASCPEILF